MPNIPISALPITTTVSPSAILILDQNGTTYQGTVAQIVGNTVSTGTGAASGIILGSGAPTLIEPQGYLYLRNNGTPDTTLYISAGGSTTFASEQLLQGPYQLLAMTETSGTVANDTSGNSNNGIYSNVLFNQSSLVGNELTSIGFNGTNSYMNSGLLIPSLPFTMEMVFSTANTNSNLRMLANDHTDQNGKGFQFRVSTNNILMDFAGFSSVNISGNYTTPTFLTLVYTGSSYTLYINGASVATQAGTHTFGQYAPAIGYNPSYGGDYWPGLASNYALYTSALTSAQVITQYQNLNTIASQAWYSVPIHLSGDADVHITNPTNGQVLTYSTALSGWTNSTPVSSSVASVVSSTSGNTPSIYSNYISTVYADSSETAAATEVPGLFVTLPAQTTPITGYVSADIIFETTHNNRFFVYLDGNQVYPSISSINNIAFQQSVSADDTSNAGGPKASVTISLVPVVIPNDGNSHTVSIWYSVEDSLSALTWYDRSITVLLPSSVTSGTSGATFSALASAFIPASYGQTSVMTFSTPATASGYVIGENIQVPYSDGSAPYVGRITAINGNSMTVYTPYPISGTSTNTYDLTILSESSLVSYYPLTDAAGSSTIIDLKSGNNGTINGNGIILGRAPLLNDSKTSMTQSDKTGASSIIIPNVALPPTNSNFSVEILVKPRLNTSTTNVFFQIGTSNTSAIAIYVVPQVSGVPVGFNINSTDVYNNSLSNYPSSLHHYVFVFNSTSQIATLYVDGEIVLSYSSGGLALGSALGYIGAGSSGQNGAPGTYRGLSLYSKALTDAEIQAHFIASGIK